METNEIKDVLMQALALDEVHVTGDGSHFQAIVVGELFAGMSRVKTADGLRTADGIHCGQPHSCLVYQGVHP